MMRLAVIDGPSQKELVVVRIVQWDQSYDIPSSHDKKRFPHWLKHLKLTKPYDRLVDISGRPDIREGDHFPFGPDPFAKET
jgi:hypothetical protein